MLEKTHKFIESLRSFMSTDVHFAPGIFCFVHEVGSRSERLPKLGHGGLDASDLCWMKETDWNLFVCLFLILPLYV